MLCRNDEDCPVGSASAQPARCLDFETKEVLTDGSHAIVGMCVPRRQDRREKCLREADCNANEGCVFYAGRTSLRVCRVTAGTKSMGAACANNAECRSGECYDRNGTQNGGAQPDVLLGPLHQEQRLRRRSTLRPPGGVEQRHPGQPARRSVSGYCQALIPAVPGEDCQSDADAPRGKTGRTPAMSPTGSATRRPPCPAPPARATASACWVASAAWARASPAAACTRTFS